MNLQRKYFCHLSAFFIFHLSAILKFYKKNFRGLDSSSCLSCIKLLRKLAEEGVSIICTIHQPSASLLALFNQVYLLSSGKCLYQGATERLVDYLDAVGSPCPQFHNPADYGKYFCRFQKVFNLSSTNSKKKEKLCTKVR